MIKDLVVYEKDKNRSNSYGGGDMTIEKRASFLEIFNSIILLLGLVGGVIGGGYSYLSSIKERSIATDQKMDTVVKAVEAVGKKMDSLDGLARGAEKTAVIALDRTTNLEKNHAELKSDCKENYKNLLLIFSKRRR